MKKKYITPKMIVVEIRKMQLLGNSLKMRVKSDKELIDLVYGSVDDVGDLDPE